MSTPHHIHWTDNPTTDNPTTYQVVAITLDFPPDVPVEYITDVTSIILGGVLKALHDTSTFGQYTTHPSPASQAPRSQETPTNDV